MSTVKFEDIVRAAREADEWGLIFEKGTIHFGTMNEGGVIKLSSGEGESFIHTQLEFQFVSDGNMWVFSPGNICVHIKGVDIDEYRQFQKRYETILEAISNLLSS